MPVPQLKGFLRWQTLFVTWPVRLAVEIQSECLGRDAIEASTRGSGEVSLSLARDGLQNRAVAGRYELPVRRRRLHRGRPVRWLCCFSERASLRSAPRR